MKQSRWRSKVFWASVIAQVVSLGQLTGIWARLGVDAGHVGDVAASVLQLAVIFGLANDPTNKTGF